MPPMSRDFLRAAVKRYLCLFSAILTPGAFLRLNSTHSRLLLGLLVLALGLGLSNCTSKKKPGTPLAKVGTATLTLEDVRLTFPQEFEQALPREQYLDFVKRWIDDEVIYQQAQKAELDKDTSIARRIEEMRRKLLIEEFMAREGAAEAVEPDEGALSQYYEVHREEFRRKVAEWRFLTLRVKSFKEALELKPKLRGSDYLVQAAPHLLDPLPEDLESLPFRKAQDIRACLQPTLGQTPVGQIAGPLTCPEGIILVKVLEKAEAGTLIAFPTVRDHIAGILMMERKSKQREGAVARYKEGALITFNLDKIPGRETPAEENEAVSMPSQESDELQAQEKAVRNSVDLAGTTPGDMPKPKPKPRPAPPRPVAPPPPLEPFDNTPANEPTGALRSDAPSAPVTDTSHAMP